MYTSDADALAYLDARAAQGFNAVQAFRTGSEGTWHFHLLPGEAGRIVATGVAQPKSVVILQTA